MNKTEREFIDLVIQHQAILHKITLVYTSDASDREDLYQEIVLQLWKSYPSFRGDAAFSTWMYRVALNTAISMTRRPSIFMVTGHTPDFADIADSPPDLSEEVKILYMAISRLNKIEKAIILLWLEERTYEEIGELAGISVKNVSVKLVRIRKKLGTIISKLR